jgi:hypothetical protein
MLISESSMNDINLRMLCINYHNEFQPFIGTVRSEIGIPVIPKDLQLFSDQLQALMKCFHDCRPPVNVEDHLTPYLKRVVLDNRFERANSMQVSLSKVSDPDIVEALHQALSPYTEFLLTMQSVKPARRPELIDYLTLERVEQIEERLKRNFALMNGQDEPKETKREFDEKFHILQSPASFLNDLQHARRKCRLRNLPVIVAFLDIDDFKQFNTVHGETVVDRFLLPRFMAAIEAHVYSRGYAYRIGGDEYVLLLPNLDKDSAAEFSKCLNKN